MENISLKQWIVAGTLSGAIIGIIIFLIITFISSGVPFLDPIFIWDVFFSSVFLGLIIGMILFLVYNKLPVKRSLSKCLLISIVSMMLITILSFYFYAFHFELLKNFWIARLIPFFAIGEIYLLIGYFSESFGNFAYLPFILIGVAFGFLINYFINRMERKASE